MRVCGWARACALACGYARLIVGVGVIVHALAFRPGIHVPTLTIMLSVVWFKSYYACLPAGLLDWKKFFKKVVD